MEEEDEEEVGSVEGEKGEVGDENAAAPEDAR
jgi:hypothetical protein